MGYPMTWARVKGRNRFGDELRWRVTMPTSVDNERFGLEIYGYAKDNVERANGYLKNLFDDIKRFEDDALDENGVCLSIAKQLDLDPEVVAAVIRKFMTW